MHHGHWPSALVEHCNQQLSRPGRVRRITKTKPRTYWSSWLKQTPEHSLGNMRDLIQYALDHDSFDWRPIRIGTAWSWSPKTYHSSWIDIFISTQRNCTAIWPAMCMLKTARVNSSQNSAFASNSPHVEYLFCRSLEVRESYRLCAWANYRVGAAWLILAADIWILQVKSIYWYCTLTTEEMPMFSM